MRHPMRQIRRALLRILGLGRHLRRRPSPKKIQLMSQTRTSQRANCPRAGKGLSSLALTLFLHGKAVWEAARAPSMSQRFFSFFPMAITLREEQGEAGLLTGSQFHNSQKLLTSP